MLELAALRSDHPERFQYRAEGGACLNLRGLPLEALRELENSPDSHGALLPHPEYVAAMHKLGFPIPGVKGDVAADIRVVVEALGGAEIAYLLERLAADARLIPPEEELVERMKTALASRPLVDYRNIERPVELPPELVFKGGDSVVIRKATEAWFAWAMKQTTFFYIGAGDLMKSILTGKAENVYGVIQPGNVLGRGLRFGIAEQNMAMMSCAMSQDTLPGGFRPMTVFATYGVFTCMMTNAVRMTLINSDVNPNASAFFIMLAAHDGPETGEDGPTHHGLFWMSLYTAYPGIKVYKPLDANEAVEMLFLAVRRGEPVAFACTRPGTPVLKRGDGAQGAPPPAKAAAISSDEERQYVVALHNGWRRFLYPFVVPGDYQSRVFGMDRFSRSGKPDEIYRNAGFDCEGLRRKILSGGK